MIDLKSFTVLDGLKMLAIEMRSVDKKCIEAERCATCGFSCCETGILPKDIADLAERAAKIIQSGSYEN